MCYLDNGSKEICESTKDILEITYDNTSPTQYKFEYRLEGLGYCGDGGQHLSPAFPPRLSPGDPLYDEDGAQECMNRCLNKNPNFRAFYTRHNGDYNDQCACAMSCDPLVPHTHYKGYHIREKIDTPTCELYSSRSDGRKNCVRSRNYPEPFHENDSCAVEFIKSGTLRIKDMNIESK